MPQAGKRRHAKNTPYGTDFCRHVCIAATVQHTKKFKKETTRKKVGTLSEEAAAVDRDNGAVKRARPPSH